MRLHAFHKRLKSLKGIKKISRAPLKKIEAISSNGDYKQKALLLGRDRIIQMIPCNNKIFDCPIDWYKRTGIRRYQRVISNRENFYQIQNIADILEKITDIMIESYKKRKPVAPFSSFGIQLSRKANSLNYGHGKLVFIKKSTGAREEESILFANEFLDCFMGWNFGEIIRKRPGLEDRLMNLNDSLIRRKERLRPFPLAFETYGWEDSGWYYSFNNR